MTTRRHTPLHARGDATLVGDDPLDALDIDGLDHRPSTSEASPEDHSSDAAIGATTSDVSDAVHHPHLPAHSARERRAFADAVRRLRTGGQSLDLSERTLMVAAGVVAPLGLVFVLLGWYGAARTPNSFEQIPYLISGGMFGLGMVFLGAFFYFAHWLTELVKESRAGSAALLEAVARLQETMAERPSVSGTAVVVGAPQLVATARGSMAHRADCPVVAGKDDLRPVLEADGLAACKMCEPYEDEIESHTAG